MLIIHADADGIRWGARGSHGNAYYLSEGCGQAGEIACVDVHRADGSDIIKGEGYELGA